MELNNKQQTLKSQLQGRITLIVQMAVAVDIALMVVEVVVVNIWLSVKKRQVSNIVISQRL